PRKRAADRPHALLFDGVRAHSLTSFFLYAAASLRHLHSFPTRRSFDLPELCLAGPDRGGQGLFLGAIGLELRHQRIIAGLGGVRSEEHTSELQSLRHLVCRLLLEKKNHFAGPRGTGKTSLARILAKGVN